MGKVSVGRGWTSPRQPARDQHSAGRLNAGGTTEGEHEIEGQRFAPRTNTSASRRGRTRTCGPPRAPVVIVLVLVLVLDLVLDLDLDDTNVRGE